MERGSETGRRLPLLVIGDPPWPLPEAARAEAGAISREAVPNINNFYILVALPPLEASAALESLQRAGVSAEQVIVLMPAEQPFAHPLQPFLGTIDWVEGECAEELRARLLRRVELQRQKKLPFLLLEFGSGEAARGMPEAELGRAIDSARIAHALACSLALSPSQHDAAIRACLLGTAARAEQPWPADLAPERLVAETAVLAQEALTRGLPVRDGIRERSVALPFRARADLLHQIENCLGALPGGKKHAA